MQSTDSLPGDQRAVLQLVLGRGRSYDQIARMLSMDPASVRERALSALESLGPQTRVTPERRAMISDYLLGQLPQADIGEVRDVLAHSAAERAWARVVSSELAPLASGPLPEIPLDTSGRADRGTGPADGAAAGDTPATRPADESGSGRASGRGGSAASRVAAASGAGVIAEDASQTEGGTGSGTGRRRRRRGGGDGGGGSPTGSEGAGPPSSRRGGILVLSLGIAVVALVVILLLTSGGSKKSPTTAASRSTSSTASASTSSSATTTSATTSSSAKVIAQINLTPPAKASKSVGIAEILNEGSSDGIAIVAQDIPPNTKNPPNAYAVWLYNSPSDAHILGFVNPGVGANGRLSTAGGLPTDASHYKQLIVTVETSAQPKTPGKIILQGTLTGL